MNNRLIRGEESNHEWSDTLNQNGHGQSETGCDVNCIAKGLCGTVVFSGSDILCAQCRDGRKRGRWNQKEEADHFFDDADCSGRVEPATVGNDGDDNESDLD